MRYLNQWVLAFCITCLIVASCTAPQADNHPLLSKLNGTHITSYELDSFLLGYMDSSSIKGLSIALINDGKIVYNNEIGIRNQYSQKPIDNNTIFEAASLSKPLFAFFVLKLIQEHKMELDTPLYKYFPYADIEHDDRYKSITSRMVLSHTTGFPNWRWQNADQQLDIKFQPGSKFSYSGEGYEYLKKTIAHLHKIPLTKLDSLFQKEITEPLNLSHLHYEYTPYVLENIASGHENDKVVYDSWMDRTAMQAAGGLYTNATNYARFLTSLMDEKLLNEEHFKDLFNVQTGVPDDDNLAKSGIHEYALGFGIKSSPQGKIYVHGGNNWGYSSGFAFNLDKKHGFVFFMNNDQANNLAPALEAYLMQD
jgi:CubicO group peptidase (beta-lactamase class C family)